MTVPQSYQQSSLRTLQYSVGKLAPMSASPSVDLSSALLVIFSLVLALYLPSLFSYVRAWFVLQRIPSPPVDHLISGHTKSLTQLKRHKHEQESIAATGKRVYRLRVFGRHVRCPIPYRFLACQTIFQPVLLMCLVLPRFLYTYDCLLHAASGNCRPHSAPRILCC